MLTQNELYYGHAAPLPEIKHLRAGPLTLIYQAGDLRYLKLGEQEVLRRIYMAVRDQNWGTVPSVLSNLQETITADSFYITYQAETKQGSIDFVWQATVQGDAQGTIQFTFEGQARSDFLSNRLGFCVLHPIRECAGRVCRVTHPDGSVTEGVFPKYISPHQPFLEIAGMAHEVRPGMWAEVRFAGDIFEMEDQRNWTDGSYKTYCTPLRLGFPHEIKAGTRITQSVTLRLRTEIGQEKLAALADVQAEPLVFHLETHGLGIPLPRVGLGIASHGQSLTDQELNRLRALNLSHLRVDLKLSEVDYPVKLRRAWQEARALNLRLEVALFLSDRAKVELQALRAEIETIKPQVGGWLIFHVQEKSTSEQWITLARQALSAYDAQARIGSGTNSNFTELNRSRPPTQSLDLICYSANPQVHAFDNASLVETLETSADIVASARQFIGSLPLAITPITLKQRSNPDATTREIEPEPGTLPRSVDVRQTSLFAAGWTLGSFKYLAESSVYSLTYYETTGWLGVMEMATGSRAPEIFRSLPGAVFPLYHVLADISEFGEGEILPVRSPKPLQCVSVALRKPGQMRMILANLQAETCSVTVKGLASTVRLRYLDETNALESMQTPEAFRSHDDDLIQTPGHLSLQLRPYALAWIDF